MEPTNDKAESRKKTLHEIDPRYAPDAERYLIPLPEGETLPPREQLFRTITTHDEFDKTIEDAIERASRTPEEKAEERRALIEMLETDGAKHIGSLAEIGGLSGAYARMHAINAGDIEPCSPIEHAAEHCKSGGQMDIGAGAVMPVRPARAWTGQD